MVYILRLEASYFEHSSASTLLINRCPTSIVHRGWKRYCSGVRRGDAGGVWFLGKIAFRAALEPRLMDVRSTQTYHDIDWFTVGSEIHFFLSSS